MWGFLFLILLLGAGAVGLWRAGIQAKANRQEPLEARIEALEARLAASEAVDWITPVTDLQHAVDRLQQDLDALSEQVARLQASINASQSGAAIANNPGQTTDPAMPVRLDVPVQRQSHNLSCESAAASMAANYLGLPLSESDILDSLPRHENPQLGFRGNVDGPTGGLQDYGVYAGPVAAVLREAGLQAEPVPGGLEGIRQALRRGHPVLAWITYDTWMQTPTPVLLSNGETVTLVNYEHVVVVIGYDGAGVWVNDPYDGQTEYYPNADMERALGYLGNMALELSMGRQP